MIKSQIQRTMLILILCSCMIMPLALPNQEQNDSTLGTDFTLQKERGNAPSPENNEGISLNDGEICTLPEFLDAFSESGIMNTNDVSKFSLAATDYNKPNITRVYWQNVTDGSEDWVTWMQPGGQVKIWFEVKGPIEEFGDSVTISFDTITDSGTTYGVNLGFSDLNSLGDVGVNDTQWYSWTWAIPDEGTLDYGFGTGYVNAFALRLYGPSDSYYEGLNGTTSQLHMYGSFRIASMQWYNLTESSDIVPINIAQPGWYVSPYYTVSIENAPIWNVEVKTEWRADVVYWLDEHISWSAAYQVSGKSYPGFHSAYPRSPTNQSKWLFVQIDPDDTYGTGIANTRGIYCKYFLNNTEIYSSNDANNLLYVVDTINPVAPYIDIIKPLNGEVFTGDSVNLDAFVSDSNSNYDIDSLIAYVDGSPIDVEVDYDPFIGRLNTTIALPQNNGVVNITLYVEDYGGLSDNVTILVRSDDPTAYFPSTYVPGHEHHALTFYEQEFTWESSLSYVSGDEYNLTFMPKVIFTVTPAVEFDLYHGTPDSVSAGDSYATYLKVTDPQLTLTINLRFELGYKFDIGLLHHQGFATLYEETWEAAKDLELGVEVLDLRYDLPGVSEYIQPFTHYEIDLLQAVPIPSSVAKLNLIIDIVPLLRVSTLLDAIVSGINSSPDFTEISFASDSLYAIQTTVSDSASGGTCGIQLDDFELSCAAGLHMGVKLRLIGEILGFNIMEVDLNEWVYDHLGITIPSLDVWLGRVSLPLTGTLSVETDVVPQQLDSEISSLFASENWINVTISLSDERDNNVVGATVDASVDGDSCTVTDIGGGEYIVSVPYTPDEFTLDVDYSKTGYIGNAESFDLYIDPLVVDSTAPSLSSVEQSITDPLSDDTVVISVSLVDTLTGIADATLHYSIDDGSSWTSVSMTHSSGSVYEGTIPAQEAGITVLYYIVAEDGAGNQVESGQLSYVVEDETTTTTTTSTTTSTETSTTSGTTSSDSTTPSGTTPPDATSTIILGIGIAGAVAVVVLLFIMKRRG